MSEVLQLLTGEVPQEWVARAACVGMTEWFFAPFGEQAEAREEREAVARAVCRQCPVLVPCRDYARRHRELGFWGGENDDQRLAARRRSTRPGVTMPVDDAESGYGRVAEA